MPLHRVPQTSGQTISASHIEAPDRPFAVEYFAPAHINVLFFEAGLRRIRVLAQTPPGALRIAQYHHYRGRDFRLIQGPTEETADLPGTA